MSSCVFCRIIAQEIPANVVHETDDIIVIKDIAPKAPLHYLVIPKAHTTSILDLADHEAALAGKMFLAARDVAKKKNIQSFRLVVNTGTESGQSVFHTHLHFLAGKLTQDF
jgi:histidine triad (HIT) family protein